jgi:hypothetical protein
MNPSPDTSETEPGGLGGTLRAVAALCVLALALAGVLLVLEVIPRSVFTDVGGKVVALGAIGALTVVALALLSRR